jgi:NAD(P) transhydrogenase subunit alpha
MHRWFLFAMLCLLLTTTAAGGQPVGGPAGKAAPAPPAAQTAEEPKEQFPLVESLFILVLAGFVGFEVIGRVSPLLHTPLMAATNAISGISLVGSLVIAGNSNNEFPGTMAQVLGFVAVTAAMINVVGGFMITDRMLRMFKKKEPGR